MEASLEALDQAKPILSGVQLRIASAPPGRLVFLGGPGAGKTTVLAARTAQLIRSGLARPQEVLVLAPSRRAASALAARARARLGGSASPESLSFHGLALALVRRHYRALGYGRPPTLLGRAEQSHLLRELLAAEEAADWPRHGDRCGGEALRTLAYDVVMGAAENGLGEAELRRRGEAAPATPLGELAGFYGRYRAHLRREELLDFGEVLLRAGELLAAHPEVAAQCRRTYRHVLVDEFEEANYAQCELLCRLIGPETDVLVAGDPAQAINGYRGGSPSYLLSLVERLGARVVESAENHRAAPGPAAVCRVTRPATVGETDRSAVAGGVGALGDEVSPAQGSVVVRPFAYPTDEARLLAAAVASLVRAGTAAEDIAVVVRSLGAPIVRLLEAELGRRGVPFHREGSGGTLREPLLRATLDLLRYLAGGEGRDAALVRVLHSPLGGLPPFGLDELRRAAALAARDLAEAVATGDLDGLGIGEGVRAALAALRERLASLQAKVGWSASGLLWEIWRLFPAFAADALAGGGASRAYGALVASVAELEEGRRPLTVAELLERLERGDFDCLAGPGAGAGGITITTVHAAKGREWDVVFLPGLCEGDFPLQRSALDVVVPLLARDLALADADPTPAVNARHLAEERRAFHVATGRARRLLYLSYSRYEADGAAAHLPSRFLDILLGHPAVAVLAGDEERQLPLDVDGAVAHYRRLLRHEDPLRQAQGLYALDRLRRARPQAVRPELWWENVAETTGAASPFPNARLHLSASRLSAYRSCPLAYQYAHHWRLYEPAGAPATVGSVLHAVLEEYHRPGCLLPRSRETLRRLLDERFDEGAFAFRPVARQARRNLEELLDKYFGRYGQDGPALAVEQEFQYPFGRHVIAGYVDRVDALRPGELELIDYKTGSPTSKDDAQGDLQLALYDLAFHEDAGLRVLGRPALVSYLYLKAIGPRADGKRSYTPTEDSRAYLRQRVAYYAEAILAERFPSYFELADAFADLDAEELGRVLGKDPCRFCAFVWLCPWQEKGMGDE